MEEMNLKKLESFIKSTSIPPIKRRPTTFLGISKQPHYENVWSNIYAFFFKASGEHHLNDLFIKSLVQLIGQKQNQEYRFADRFSIETERSTSKKGRMDLLLYSDEEAIIIENKVYHRLNNDLKDYWDSVKQPNKTGVVLSLKKISRIGNKNFINITHLELMQCVMDNLPAYFSNANDKYLIYLKDFYQNVINMSNPIDQESLKFYYQYQSEINSINNIRNSIAGHIKLQVEEACGLLDINLNLYKPGGTGESRYRYYTCKNEGNLMFTIYFSELFRINRNLKIIVEVQNDLLKRRDELKNIEFTENEQELLKQNFYTTKERWAHFAVKSYNLSDDEITNLSSFIVAAINGSTILSIFKKVEAVLVENNKI